MISPNKVLAIEYPDKQPSNFPSLFSALVRLIALASIESMTVVLISRT